MKHVVVGVISKEVDSEKKYLLMASKSDFGKFTGFYYPPGGHLEDGEDEKSALTREIKEGLGVNVEPIAEITKSPGDVKDQITHWWKCEFNLNQQFTTQEDEVLDVKWFSEAEIRSSQKIWPATRKFFNEHVFIDNEAKNEISTS